MTLHTLALTDATRAMADSINEQLSMTGSVLLLLSGGSNIETATAIRPLLRLSGAQLTVGLIDERFGPVGHADSNWAKLEAAGFDFTGVARLPILTGDSYLESTAADYNDTIAAAYATHAVTIGLLGLGTDGHTAGILPGSAALAATTLVTSYIGPDYHRITLTPSGLLGLDCAFLVAYGDNKHDQLMRLTQTIEPTKQPAQLLKAIETLMVYSDQKDIL